MSAMLKTLLLMGVFLTQAAMGQDLAQELREKIDGAIDRAYESAAAAFPCKLKAAGKAKMLHWEQVDRCLGAATGAVDWDALSRQLQDLRQQARGPMASEFSAVVESSLSAHAVSYEKVFAVNNADVLLPLTNSVLKYLAPDALLEVPVMDKAGQQVGIFSGIYDYDRTGGLATANTFRLKLFQYTDLRGQMQVPTDRLLLDSFGVPWKSAAGKGAFRLTSEKLLPKY
jgi:hypothetical protein